MAKWLEVIWDHLAPVTKQKIQTGTPLPNLEDEQPPTVAELKAKHDTELAIMEAEADYQEKRKKLQARLDAVVPQKHGVLDTILKSKVTTDAKGRRQSNSFLARMWRRVPVKPVVVPLAFVGFVLLIMKAC